MMSMQTESASDHQRRLLEIDDVCDLLHVSRSLMAKWRMQGRGPRFIKVGRRILYDRDELAHWLQLQMRSSTTGPAG